MTPGSELVAMRGGLRVAVPHGPNLITPYVLKEQGDWFEDEMHFVRTLCAPGMNVVDVGANHGVYALTMGQRVAPKGKVWAFEPAKKTAELLRESVRENGLSSIEVVEAGLSNREGEATFYTEENSELNTLNPSSTAGRTSETIRLRTLDACAKAYGWTDIAFLKLDAEGEEERILEAGQEFLASNAPLILFELKHGQTVNASLLDWFRAHGHALYRLMPGPNVLVPYAGTADAFLLNLFACTPERAEKLERAGLLARGIPAHVDLPSPAPTMWSTFSRHFPYARALEASWAKRDPTADRAVYVDLAIARFIQSRARKVFSPAVRCGALHAAIELLGKALVEPRVPTLFTTARVALELGQRGLALQAMDTALSLLQNGKASALDEPFLSPNPRFDTIDPAGSLEKWCLAALIEQIEKSSHYSSFYTKEVSLPRLRFFHELGFSGPEMERRLALVEERMASR